MLICHALKRGPGLFRGVVAQGHAAMHVWRKLNPGTSVTKRLHDRTEERVDSHGAPSGWSQHLGAEATTYGDVPSVELKARADDAHERDSKRKVVGKANLEHDTRWVACLFRPAAERSSQCRLALLFECAGAYTHGPFRDVGVFGLDNVFH